MLRLDGRPITEAELRAMSDAINYRGPDGEGFLCNAPAGLAHRRLAIIDLTTGDQPIFNEDGSVAVVFNGEIYNFLDLRAELLARGHTFKTKSDTEVLVHGWEEWGTALASRLNGMFAFAIWDRRRRKMYLACDRLGVKPLYLYSSREAHLFASELGALLASGTIPRELDLEALELYLHYQYIPAPLSIYQRVRKLEPAQWAELDAETGALRIETYWDLPKSAAPDPKPSLGEWRERLRALLEDAVRIRLISDVPFGAFLSGGTDSGTVVALMAGKLSEPVRTFSIGLDDGGADELPYAREIAKRYGTAHREFRVSPEGLTLIPKLAPHFGEPFADSSAIPTWYVSKLAREHVKMVLTGDGGDELFAGYRSYAALAMNMNPAQQGPLSQLPRPRLSDLRRLRDPRTAARQAYRRARRLAGSLVRQARARAGMSAGGVRTLAWFDHHDGAMQHFSAEQRRALLGARPQSGADYFASRHVLPQADSVIASAQYVDLKSYLPGDVLTKVDRMSMANSLEVRSPFLDYRVAELAFAMPTEMKLKEPLLDGSKGKLVLKELAAPLLGRDYVFRPKEGFGIPVDRWLREDSHGYLRDSLLASKSPIYDYLDGRAVRELVESHRAGTANHAPRLWNLLMLDAWFRTVHRGAR